VHDRPAFAQAHSFISRLAERTCRSRTPPRSSARTSHDKQGHFTHVRGNADARVEQLREVLT